MIFYYKIVLKFQIFFLNNTYKNVEIIDVDELNKNNTISYQNELKANLIKDKNEANEFFPLIIKNIKDSLSKLNNKIFCKLNWSSAKDAIWISTTKSLQCNTIGDILLLLKSSNKIAHDLIDKNKYTNQYYLHIQSWCNYHQSNQYRCFIKNNQLIAITQRDYTYYKHLNANDIQQKILKFFINIIQSTLYSQQLSTYTIDLYIDKNDKIWIIDIGIFNKSDDCNLYLFKWDELNDLNQLTIKLVTKDMNLNPIYTAKHIIERLPDEIFDVSDQKGIDYMVNIMKLQNLNDIKEQELALREEKSK